MSNSYRKAKGGKAGFRGLLLRTGKKIRCDLTQASKERRTVGDYAFVKETATGARQRRM